MSARSEAKQLNQALPVNPIDSTNGASSEDVVVEMLRRSEKGSLRSTNSERHGGGRSGKGTSLVAASVS